MPEPGNTSTRLSAGPQALNRYSYVLNNPLRYSDPTGMFTEDAVWNYLVGFCGGYEPCAQDYYNQWYSDTEWWSMIMGAEAGDVLFGSFQIGAYPQEEFAFTFTGSGDSVLSGIQASNMGGNYQAGILNQATLQDIFAGSSNLLSYGPPFQFTWGGLVDFSEAQVVFRSSTLSGIEYMPDYGGNSWSELFRRTKQATASWVLKKIACYGVGGPACSIMVSVAYGTLGEGTPYSSPQANDYVMMSAGVEWIYSGSYNNNGPSRMDIRHIGEGSIFGNRLVDLVLRVSYQ